MLLTLAKKMLLADQETASCESRGGGKLLYIAIGSNVKKNSTRIFQGGETACATPEGVRGKRGEEGADPVASPKPAYARTICTFCRKWRNVLGGGKGRVSLMKGGPE